MTGFVPAMAEPAFAAVMGFVFVFAKMFIRFTCKQCVRRKYDTKDALAWFGVDIGVVAVAIWITGGLEVSLGLKRIEVVGVYFALLVGLMAAATCYALALHCSGKKGNSSWVRTVLATLWAVGGMTIGFAMYLSAMSILLK